MSRLPLAFTLAVGLAPLACSEKTACDIACATNEMIVNSSTANLVSAQDSCGQSARCPNAACVALELPPPPDGGTCDVVVRLSDGSTVSTTADWGVPHATACCGTQFERTPRLDLASDAGGD